MAEPLRLTAYILQLGHFLEGVATPFNTMPGLANGELIVGKLPEGAETRHCIGFVHLSQMVKLAECVISAIDIAGRTPLLGCRGNQNPLDKAYVFARKLASEGQRVLAKRQGWVELPKPLAECLDELQDAAGVEESAPTSIETPLIGDEATATVNKMLENEPPWSWKEVKMWLKKRGVKNYNRKSWIAQFKSEPPNRKGNVALVNEAELMIAVWAEIEVHNRAFDQMDSIAERKESLRRK